MWNRKQIETTARRLVDGYLDLYESSGKEEYRTRAKNLMEKYCLWMNDDGTSCPVEVDYKSGQYYCPVHKVEREKMLKKHSFRRVRVSSYDLGKAERGEHGS